MKRKLYQHFASRLQAMQNCAKDRNVEWYDKHETVIERLCKNHMPSGSGFDNGTTLDPVASIPDRLVFSTAYHHMNEAGYYDGWSDHRVVVRPSLAHGFTLHITGRDRNDIKDYIADVFNTALAEEIDDTEIALWSGIKEPAA